MGVQWGVTNSLSLITTGEVVEALRQYAYGSTGSQRTFESLVAMGLISPAGTLTSIGELIEEAYFVDERPQDVQHLLREAYLKLPLVQVVVQNLAGKERVPLTGLLHRLVKSGRAGVSDIGPCRQLVEALSGLGIVVFSRRTQTVRVVRDDSMAAQEQSVQLRVINPEKPFTNLLHLRSIIRECKDFLYWADPHLSKKALEVLAPELDGQRLKEIRLLSGPAQIGKATIGDFDRFKAEAASLGIDAHWRILDGTRDWHDRFLLGRGVVWNIPPINSLLKNDYSEAWKSDTTPPFDKWWDQAEDISAFSSKQ